MTLTILATSPSPDLYGSARMLIESVTGFRDAGWRVVVSVPHHGPLVGEVEALGVEVRTCMTPVLRKQDLSPVGMARLAWLTVRSIPAELRLLRAVRPDVLYANTSIQPLWLLLARLARVPVVCHIHEGESGASPLVRRALAVPLLLARSLVVNSGFSMGVFTKAVARLERRCTVIYNGVAGPSAVVPPREALDSVVRLLFVGRLSERKGVQDAVDAVVELDRRGIRAELDIVGSAFADGERMEADLRSRAASAGLSERVRLHGFDSVVWPHLAATDILLVPSRMDEPFGNTAVEGALAARPVVATATGGLPEATAGMGATTLVPPGDPVALAEAIVGVVHRWSELRSLALEDAARAADRYGLSRYRASIRDVVASAAQS